MSYNLDIRRIQPISCAFCNGVATFEILNKVLLDKPKVYSCESCIKILHTTIRSLGFVHEEKSKVEE